MALYGLSYNVGHKKAWSHGRLVETRKTLAHNTRGGSAEENYSRPKKMLEEVGRNDLLL